MQELHYTFSTAGQVLAFCQTSFTGLMSFSERTDNKQREKAMKTYVPLGVITLITMPILLLRSQLANILLMQNYLFFFYHLLPLCSLVPLILPLFFRKNWYVSLWLWQWGFKELKDALYITYLCRYYIVILELKGKNDLNHLRFLFVLSGSLQKQRLMCTL